MARDKQKSKVYKWEETFYEKDRLFRKNCIVKQHKRLNKKFFRSFGRGVTLKITNGDYGCNARYKTKTITLRNKFGLNYAILLHEWAHILAYEYYDKNHSLESHGPEFVSIYMNLLNTYLDIDIKEMTRKAREMNIDFISPAKTKAALKLNKSNKPFSPVDRELLKENFNSAT